MIKALTLTVLLSLSSCAYRAGYSYRELPRGIKTLYIPIFKNDTLEVGPETPFTSQLTREIKRANVAKLVGKSTAEGVLEGRIIRIIRQQRSHESRGRGETKTEGIVNLPEGTYVAIEYLLKIQVELRLKKRETNQIVWIQDFEDQAIYFTARLGLAGINTSNPNYTDSEEKRIIKNLASVMMQEAVGRLTENF